jgi:hypothetical protein
MRHLYVGITAFPPGETQVLVSWEHYSAETGKKVRVEVMRVEWQKEAESLEDFSKALRNVADRLESLVRGEGITTD